MYKENSSRVALKSACFILFYFLVGVVVRGQGTLAGGTASAPATPLHHLVSRPALVAAMGAADAAAAAGQTVATVTAERLIQRLFAASADVWNHPGGVNAQLAGAGAAAWMVKQSEAAPTSGPDAPEVELMQPECSFCHRACSPAPSGACSGCNQLFCGVCSQLDYQETDTRLFCLDCRDRNSLGHGRWRDLPLRHVFPRVYFVCARLRCSVKTLKCAILNETVF